MKTEFEFIKAIKSRSKTQTPKSKVKVGIGDDCAVIPKDKKTDLVITTDLLVEDIDFRLDWTRAEFLGHKALAVSLSDVAAMGATPVWALVSIGVPEKIWKSAFVNKFYEGWFELANKFGVELIGGDVSKTPDKIIIDSIVAGEVKKDRAILRSGAKIGDLIFVTGELGGAAAGLELLENGVRLAKAADWQMRLMTKQLTPLPQCDIGNILGKKKLANAMIDLSDGLSSDIAHLCKASDVGATIYVEKISVATELNKNPEFEDKTLQLALNGGEDFELLFTVSPKNIKKVREDIPSAALLGEITKPNQGLKLVKEAKTTALSANGFSHF